MHKDIIFVRFNTSLASVEDLRRFFFDEICEFFFILFLSVECVDEVYVKCNNVQTQIIEGNNHIPRGIVARFGKFMFCSR